VERLEALESLGALVGQDLRALAEKHGITVWKAGHKNKGWAGHTLERVLGLPLNSAQSPNFGSWELKLIPLVATRSGSLRVKETMAITMIDPYEVSAKEFEQSHLFNKLTKIVIAARVFESIEDDRSILHSVSSFDLDDPAIYSQVKADYDLVRHTIREQGYGSLSGRMGVLVQPRTKGPGHGSTSRAFYARTKFVAKILPTGYHLPLPVTPSADEPTAD